jgi:hypothetical protein
MNQYLVLKTHIDRYDNIKTQVKIYQEQIEARVNYLTLIQELKAQVSFLYSVPLEEFEIKDFGDVEEERDFYVFKDFEGAHNIKIELKKI